MSETFDPDNQQNGKFVVENNPVNVRSQTYDGKTMFSTLDVINKAKSHSAPASQTEYNNMHQQLPVTHSRLLCTLQVPHIANSTQMLKEQNSDIVETCRKVDTDSQSSVTTSVKDLSHTLISNISNTQPATDILDLEEPCTNTKTSSQCNVDNRTDDETDILKENSTYANEGAEELIIIKESCTATGGQNHKENEAVSGPLSDYDSKPGGKKANYQLHESLMNTPTKKLKLDVAEDDDLDSLKKKITENKEILRRLKLAKTYKLKQRDELDALIGKWRRASQNALVELLDYVEKPTMMDLLKYYNIDPNLVKFDSTKEIFIHETN